MHALSLSLTFPSPRFVGLDSITHPVQHIDHIPANGGQELPTVEGPSSSQVQIVQTVMRMPGNDGVLIGGDRVPADAEVVYPSMGVEDLGQARTDGFDTFLAQTVWDFCLIALRWIELLQVRAWWWDGYTARTGCL